MLKSSKNAHKSQGQFKAQEILREKVCLLCTPTNKKKHRTENLIFIFVSLWIS